MSNISVLPVRQATERRRLSSGLATTLRQYLLFQLSRYLRLNRAQVLFTATRRRRRCHLKSINLPIRIVFLLFTISSGIWQRKCFGNNLNKWVTIMWTRSLTANRTHWLRLTIYLISIRIKMRCFAVRAAAFCQSFALALSLHLHLWFGFLILINRAFYLFDICMNVSLRVYLFLSFLSVRVCVCVFLFVVTIYDTSSTWAIEPRVEPRKRGQIHLWLWDSHSTSER